MKIKICYPGFDLYIGELSTLYLAITNHLFEISTSKNKFDNVFEIESPAYKVRNQEILYDAEYIDFIKKNCEGKYFLTIERIYFEKQSDLVLFKLVY